LLTAGDDGTVHLWDSTARSPKAVVVDQATFSTHNRRLFFTYL
jgi:hypothetical protein